MISIEQVPAWIVSCGISHAIGRIAGGWCYTACNSMMTGDHQKQHNGRICKRCRERLKVATLVGDSQPTRETKP